MTYDDDNLDRMLAALPLEEPPAGLHERILATTVYRPRPDDAAWEVWLVGTLIALAAWLSFVVVTTPHAGEQLMTWAVRLTQNGGLTSLNTLLWLAVGASAAWISQLSFPRGRRIEVR